MSRRGVLGAAQVLAVIASLFAAAPAAAQVTAAPDGITRLVDQFHSVVAAGDIDGYLRLVSHEVDRVAARGAAEGLLQPGATRVAVRVQDRTCEQAGACRLIVEVLREFGSEGRLATWRLDVRPQASATTGDAWEIVGQQPLTSINGLFKLALDPQRAYSARGVTVEAEDIRLRMTEGSVFVAEAEGRPTTFVFVGKGEMTFTPTPATERGQLRIFAGGEQLHTVIDAAFVRVNPAEVDDRIKGLGEPQPDLRDLKHAEEIFRENNRRSFALDLAALSPDVWSLIPRDGDFLSEIYTRRYGTLTFGLTPAEAEDIVLFDRKARRNIAQYASRARLAMRGRFYDDGEKRDYEVTDYDVDARFTPARDWIDARVGLAIRVRGSSLSSVNLRLDDSLAVHSVMSAEFGRLMALRVNGRNAVIVTLPATLVKDTRLTLTVAYSGTIRSQRLDREAVSVDARQDPMEGEGEPGQAIDPSYLYSNRPFWYPQPATDGFATATLRLAVPRPFGVVASGVPVPQPGDGRDGPATDAAGYRRFVFVAREPLRYLSLAIAPLVTVKSSRVKFGDSARAGAARDGVDVHVQTNPREKGLGKDLHKRVTDIVQFYARLIGDCPYPVLNIALIEQNLPGGHSPAYVTALNYVSPRASVTWKGDPAYIAGFPEYFLAHEIAHQWWGQAVGWKNYHEQWLSEGFAQYFAALYAQHAHGGELFQDILKQWQRWTADKSGQGPVYLGYRVGHIKGDARVFRAVVYNKSALVLHMLRRLVGDDVFFRGLRRFYAEWRFRKAGTNDLQRAMEAEARTSLQRFFDGWIYGDSLPRIRAATRTETADGRELVVRLEQEGPVFDVPVTVSIDYANRPPAEVTVRLAQAQQEFRIPLAGPLRKVDLNRVHVAPVSDFAVMPWGSEASAALRGARPR